MSGIQSEPDRLLVRRCLEGDRDAFGVLVRRYEQRVHAIAYGRVLDHARAQDVTQDTFLRAYERLGQLRQPDHFRTWVCRIALSVSLNSLRRRGREIGVIDGDESLSMVEALAVGQLTLERNLDMRRIVQDALASLPESLRIPVTLRYMDDASIRSVAESLAISPSNAQTRIWRGIERLRSYLKGRGLDDDCVELLRTHALGAPIAAQLADLVMEGIRDATPPRSGPASQLPRLGYAAAGAVLGVGVLTGGTTGVLSIWGDMKDSEQRATTSRPVSVALVQSTRVATAWPRIEGSVLVWPGREWMGWEPAAPQNSTTFPTVEGSVYRSPPTGAVVSNDHGVLKRFAPSEGVVTIDMWIRPALGDANTLVQIVPAGIDDEAFSLVFKNERDRWAYTVNAASVYSTDVLKEGHTLKVVYTTATATWDIYLDRELMVEGVTNPKWRGLPVTGIVIVSGDGSNGLPTYFDDLRIVVASDGSEVRPVM